MRDAVERPEDPFWPARDALVHMRRARGLTQRRVAELAGVHQSYMCRLETGQIAEPSMGILTVWAAAVRARVVVRVRGGRVEWWVTPDD